MVKQLTEEQLYKEASKKVKERKRFYGGLATYLIGNAVLISFPNIDMPAKEV
ncbi:2TM domain-containing protein [Chloroflexota bacterium]